MQTTKRQRIALIVATSAALVATTAGCQSGESATEDFKKDLKAVGLKVDGDVTVDSEKVTLGMAPVGFIAGTTRPRSTSTAKGDSPSDSKKDSKNVASKAPTPSASTSTSSAASKKKDVLEALVKVEGSTRCRAQLERAKNATGGKKIKGREVQAYKIDEVVFKDGSGFDVNSAPGTYDMQAIVAHLRSNENWRSDCFAKG